MRGCGITIADMPGTNLGRYVNELLGAVEDRDEQRFYVALEATAHATVEAPDGQVQEALARLVPVLARIPFGSGADLAPLVGGMAGYGTDPTVVVPVLVARAIDAMEQAARFEQWYRADVGDVPDPGDTAKIESTLDRFVGGATEHGMTERDASMLVQAWFCGGQWVQPVLYLAQRKDVRAILPERPRLIAATEAVQEWIETAQWLHGLLLVLDDEPLIVLHRATGRGFRLTISGIGDNFQFHTLLAAALIGEESEGKLAGKRPTAAEIAAACDGEDLTPTGGIRGCFNLTDADGNWIWNEGMPADIPKLEGVRVVVLDPPPYQRTWNAGRPYPLMRPDVTVYGTLPADEASYWLGLVKPAPPIGR